MGGLGVASRSPGVRRQRGYGGTVRNVGVQGTCDRGWVVARLTIHATALSCTSARWEMAKGSRSWERRRKAAAVPGRRHGTAWHSLAQPGTAWLAAGQCLGWGTSPSCPSQQPAVARQVTVSCCCLCCLPLHPEKPSLHPHPRLWGDHLPGNLWSGLRDMAHGGDRG